MQKMNTVIVTGYAKAPQGTSMYEIYRYAGLVLEIKLESHEIVDAEFTMIAELTKKFLKTLLVGYVLSDGLDGLIKRIENHYLAPSQQAIIVALQAADQRYWNYIKDK